MRVKAPGSPEYHATRRLMRELRAQHRCEEAACPNIGECWKQKHATVMILGAVCTRACTFCNVATGRPDLLDPHEPERVGEAVAHSGLPHIVVTSVDRDDLDDGGAGHFARTIAAIRAAAPDTTIEVLTPDFLRKDGRDRSRRRGPARRLQPQSRNRAAALCRGAARRALFPLAAAARSGQAARSGDVHQIGDHGRARRRQDRGAAGHGRSARGRGRFPDHRPISPADAEASCGRPLCHAGRVRQLSQPGPRQGLSDGLGLAVDPLLLSCRATISRGCAPPAPPSSLPPADPAAMPTHAEQRVLPYTPEQLFALVADIERYPEFLPWCVGARISERRRRSHRRRSDHRLSACSASASPRASRSTRRSAST